MTPQQDMRVFTVSHYYTCTLSTPIRDTLFFKTEFKFPKNYNFFLKKTPTVHFHSYKLETKIESRIRKFIKKIKVEDEQNETHLKKSY